MSFPRSTAVGLPARTDLSSDAPDAADDLVLALVIAGLWWLDLVVVGPANVPQPAATVLVLLTCLPLAFRRVQPLIVVTAVWSSLMLQGAIGIDPDVSILPAVAVGLAMYSLGADPSDERALAGLMGSVMAASALVLAVPGYGAGDFLIVGLPVVLPFLAGRLVLHNQEPDEAPPLVPVSRRAEPTALSVSRERTRIAQDLHGLLRTEMRGQAPDPTAVQRRIAELDRLVDLLGGDRAPDVPVPDATDVPRLLEEAAADGAELTLHLELPDGERTDDLTALDLPAGLSLAVFRVLEEAIDNVVDHAAPCTGEVRIVRGVDQLDVEVVDDGPPLTDAVRGGGGLLAVRERASAHGGSLYAARRDAGGVRIRVRFPLPQDEEAPAVVPASVTTRTASSSTATTAPATS